MISAAAANRRWTLLAALLALAAIAVSGLGGCGATAKRPAGQSPWPEEGAPDELHYLADDLMAFQTATGRMPANLAELEKAGLATGGPYAKHAYVYHPLGIGILPEGWRVMAVDDRMREPNQVWCVLRPAVRVNGVSNLRVALVPMATLREVADAANGVK